MSQRHHASPDFWASYRSLPAETRELADRAFSILKVDSRHPSLQLRKVGPFWIGNHAEYEKLIG